MLSLDSLMSLDEAAQALKISIHTVRAWSFQRKFPTVKLGRRRLIQRADLEKFVAKGVVPAAGEAKEG